MAHDTTVYKNTPVMLKNDAVVTSDYFPGMAVTGPRTVGVDTSPVASKSVVATPHTYIPSGIAISSTGSTSTAEKSSSEKQEQSSDVA